MNKMSKSAFTAFDPNNDGIENKSNFTNFKNMLEENKCCWSIIELSRDH